MSGGRMASPPWRPGERRSQLATRFQRPLLTAMKPATGEIEHCCSAGGQRQLCFACADVAEHDPTVRARCPEHLASSLSQPYHVRHTDGYVDVGDDVSLYWQRWKRTGSLGVVLLVHDFASRSQRLCRHVTPRLLQRGFSVVAYDQRNHGRSELRMLDFTAYEEDRNAVVEALMCEHHMDLLCVLRSVILEDWPDAAVFVYGDGFGATVALDFGLKLQNEQLQRMGVRGFACSGTMFEAQSCDDDDGLNDGDDVDDNDDDNNDEDDDDGDERSSGDGGDGGTHTCTTAAESDAAGEGDPSTLPASATSSAQSVLSPRDDKEHTPGFCSFLRSIERTLTLENAIVNTQVNPASRGLTPSDLGQLSRDLRIPELVGSDPVRMGEVNEEVVEAMNAVMESVFLSSRLWRYPLLLVHGGSDEVSPLGIVRRWASGCNVSVKLVVVEGARHWLHHEINPARSVFLERLSEHFLSQLDAT